MSKDLWFVMVENNIEGPFPCEEIDVRLCDGRVNRETLIGHDKQNLSQAYYYFRKGKLINIMDPNSDPVEEPVEIPKPNRPLPKTVLVKPNREQENDDA